MLAKTFELSFIKAQLTGDKTRWLHFFLERRHPWLVEGPPSILEGIRTHFYLKKNDETKELENRTGSDVN